MNRISFDELLAKREQREADRYRIGEIAVPGTDQTLEARTPSKKAVLELYGEFAEAETAQDVLACGIHTLYAVCPQLQDRTLQTELGVAENPMDIVDALFTLPEQDKLGGAALRFLRLIPDKKKTTDGSTEPDGESDEEDAGENAGVETVKN